MSSRRSVHFLVIFLFLCLSLAFISVYFQTGLTDIQSSNSWLQKVPFVDMTDSNSFSQVNSNLNHTIRSENTLTVGMRHKELLVTIYKSLSFDSVQRIRFNLFVLNIVAVLLIQAAIICFIYNKSERKCKYIN